MHERLQDLRLLYLAMRIEEAFEGLERAFERHLPLGPARDALKPIFLEGAGHKALKAAFDEASRSVQQDSAKVTAQELLQAMLDCERIAQAFYQDHLDDLSDPKLVELFRVLAREEGEHQKAVRRAMALTPAGVSAM